MLQLQCMWALKASTALQTKILKRSRKSV